MDLLGVGYYISARPDLFVFTFLDIGLIEQLQFLLQFGQALVARRFFGDQAFEG